MPGNKSNLENNIAWNGLFKFYLSRNSYLLSAIRMSTFLYLFSSGRLHRNVVLETEDFVQKAACLSQIWHNLA